MKTIQPGTSDAFATANALRAEPVLIIDWNLNRYHDCIADNVPSDQDGGYDVELFPIESIIEPNRPDKGINKARVGHAKIGDKYRPQSDNPHISRYYVASQDDKYKYWTSPVPAVGGLIPTTDDMTTMTDSEGELLYPDVVADGLTSARPYVSYGTFDTNDPTRQTILPSDVQANKIVIKFENSWSSPNDFDIVITDAAGTPTTINSAALVREWRGTGNIVLRYVSGAWTDDADWPDIDANDMPATAPVQKVQLVVRTLQGGYEKTPYGAALVPTTYISDDGVEHTTSGATGFLDVIEISARLEADLSAYVINTSTVLDMSDVSNLYPIGTVTSNNGSLTLTNLYKDVNNPEDYLLGAFNHRNTNVIWHDYVDANAEVHLYYDFYNEDTGLFLERIKELTMYTGTWAGQEDEQVTVDLTDYSTFFNSQLVNAAMWENVLASEAVWRVLDSVGFSNYIVDDAEDDFEIPVFYMTSDQNVWEILNELSKDSQMAIYFDAYGTLRVKPATTAFDSASTPVLTLTSEDITGQNANIISLSQDEQFEPNSFTVTYQKTNWEPYKGGNPVLQKVWEPDGTEALRATPLVRDFHSGDTFLYISSSDARIWPWTGIVNIDGEFVKYKGKQVVYYTGANGNTRKWLTVESQDDLNKKVKSQVDPKYRYKIQFTGALKVEVSSTGELQRGIWNTEERTHTIESTGWNVRHIKNGVHRTGVGGFRQIKSESKARLHSTGGFKAYKDILVATHGASTDTAFYHYGAKFRIVGDKSATTQRVGLLLHNSGSNEDGYYIEITPSSKLGGKERKSRDEVILYSRVNGKDTQKGRAKAAIGVNIDYEIDIDYRNLSGDHEFTIWLNGKNIMTKTITTNKNAPNGRFGMFLRGKSIAEYEYIYGIKNAFPKPLDDFDYLDKIKTSYAGGRWDREWVYQWKTKRRRIKKRWRRIRVRLNNRFFDDFGPYVHEIREYDVKFDPMPVQHSRLFMTNDWSAVALDYRASPFDAHFTIANTSRATAVINGDDSISYAGTGASISQVLTVLGRVLVIADDATVTAENASQIARRGKNESELGGTWIQSRGMAQKLADWINDNFSYGNENVSVDIFGDPRIEIGDVVHVNYPTKQVDTDFYVVGVETKFDQGYATTLTLRERS